MIHTKKGRKVALVAGLALVVLSVAMVWTYWKEICFFLKFERLGRNEQGYPEYRHRQTEILFVSLPGGTFEMGTSNEEGERIVDEEMRTDNIFLDREVVEGLIASEQPRHKVTLSPFFLAKYELSQADLDPVDRVLIDDFNQGIRAQTPVDVMMRDDPDRFPDRASAEKVWHENILEIERAEAVGYVAEPQGGVAALGAEGPEPFTAPEFLPDELPAAIAARSGNGNGAA